MSRTVGITDIQIPALLRASHIKPWRMSDNSERLDPENGLLLVANLDAAFDAGLLSFTDTGRMLFSATRC
jgi:predicted restriction endonuclease